MSGRILVIEDNANLASNLKLNLEYERYEVRIAVDGPEGWQLIHERTADLIILDLKLPGMDGFEILRRMGKARIRTPVMIFTGLDGEPDAIRGLDLGAIVYVRKSAVGVREIIARVRALLRSFADSPYTHPDVHRIPGTTDWVRFGDIKFSLRAGRLIRAGKHKESLAPGEARLLDCFLRHAGEDLSRTVLLREVWGIDAALETRVVDELVSKLRKKLGESWRRPLYITTIRGVGYRFDPVPSRGGAGG